MDKKDRKLLEEAIKGKNLIRVVYKKRGPRVVEPYLIGVSSTGNELLRAFQVHGFSESQETYAEGEDWRLFKMDELMVHNIVMVDDPKDKSKKIKSSFVLRPEYNPADKAMVKIELCAKNGWFDKLKKRD